ncbi:GNAT family N-acetyltransferase [Labilibaculum filiforme]|uniref:GNAT family N-acetyltransferase n=1 Tax=Labilibaculum filiforme TaxID=1940526 RepID=A0A2N3I6J1_9BACT|nr:GNAT family protein [Labilibaculum filiforme]PKQ65920.1 GNAT family N-acetyltransferase [Labilibaculum filiforme]
MITLKPLVPENLPSFYQWIKDEEAIVYSLSIFQAMKTDQQIKEWYLSSINDKRNSNRGIFVDGVFVGYAGISGISSTNKSGEYFIFIGDKNYWGKGIGSEVTKMIVKIAFTELDLNRLMLTVSVPNVAGVKAYQRAGFVLEGRLRQAALRKGEFHDKLVMSILKSEWSL